MKAPETPTPTPASSAVRAFIASLGFATLPICLTLGPAWFYSVDSLLFVAMIVLIVTAITGALIGLPLYLLALQLRAANFATATLGGAITGALPPLLFLRQDIASGGSIGWVIPTYALIGAVSGLLFWLVARPRATS